ncbi:Sodium/sulfate symporter [Sporodiniella umbellata]|nr:Sodium/sulfate symporter [Sporodiniella umbellata]
MNSIEPIEERTPLLPYHSTQRRSVYYTFCQKIQTLLLFQLLPSVLIGCCVWWGLNPTEDLTPTAIRLLSVFISCIIALLSTSINISVVVLIALTFLSLTQSFQCYDQTNSISVECRLCGQLDPRTGLVYACQPSDAFERSLAGFSSTVVWLIFAAFHLGKAVQLTGLGKRTSLWMIRSFGKHIIGLAYAILFSELVLAPFVPSNTARGGGILLPVVQSIASSLGSTPEINPKMGGYLMLVGAHANLLSSSMYLTGMAASPILLDKANRLFPGLHFDFMTWLIGSIVPVMVCALLLPYLLARACGVLSQMSVKESERHEVVDHAKRQLNDMGAMTCKEWQLCCILLSCLVLWSTSAYTEIDSTLVALLGVALLIVLQTIEWKDIVSNTHAWESIFWLGGFITIATQLSEAGASTYLGSQISLAVAHFHLPVIPTLAIAYFLTSFLFSSLTAHTVAFVGTFLDAGHSLGANPMLLTCLLAYFGALGGCMTNYSTGAFAMYFTPGYVSRNQWFLIGIQLALFYIFIYFTIGYSWWTFLGWN